MKRCAPIAALALVLAATSPAYAATTTYRAVALARNGDRLILAGGGVLNIAPGCACAAAAAGRAVAIDLDADGFVTALRAAPSGTAATPSAGEVPARAYVFEREGAGTADSARLVAVTIVVTVPARTPSGDDIYLSTERSGFRPAEIRMNRVDALHWSAVLTLPYGGRIAYRITRGSLATSERDAAKQLPPAHILQAERSAEATVTVASWADLD